MEFEAIYAVTERLAVQCDYDSWTALVVSFARLSTWVIGFAIGIFGWATHEPLFKILGWTLTYVNTAIIPYQYYFAVLRADPFCPSLQTWAFPNPEMVYIANVLVVIVGYTILWKSHRTVWEWIGIGGSLILFPAIFLIFDHAVWWHLLISFVIGSGVGVLFMFWIWTYEESFIYIFNIWPLPAYYSDSVLLRCSGSKTRCKELRKFIEQLEQQSQSPGSSPLPFSILSSKYGATSIPVVQIQLPT